MTLWTRLTLSFLSFKRMLAHQQRAGRISLLLCLEAGVSPTKRDIRVGAFCCNSIHTVSHVKCSSAVFVFRRRMESWESELTDFISALTVPHISVRSSGRKVMLPTAAFAIERRFPRPTYLPSFFSD